jgi:hypothetical protein
MAKKDIWLICNAKRKSNHCKTHCFCGKPHLKETGRDACHLNYEYCSLGIGIQKVICVQIKEKK